MKATFVVLAVLLAIGLTTAGMYAGVTHRQCPVPGNTMMSGCPMQSACCGQPAAQKATTVSAVCPVMGSKIPDVTKAAGKSVYKGKTYYFCCASCKPLFDKNPEKYVPQPPPAKP